MASEKYESYKRWYDEVKGWALNDVLTNMNLIKKSGRFGPCPACGTSEDKMSRPPVRVTYVVGQSGGSGKATMDQWTCNHCHVKGNIFDFVAYKETGGDASSIRPRGYGMQQLFADACLSEPPVGNSVDKVKKIEYPPTKEVLALLQKSTIINKCKEKRILNFFKNRGLLAEKINTAGVAPGDFPYESLTVGQDRNCSWYLRSWAKSYPILIPLVDYRGDLKSIMARALNNSKQKTTCPIGFQVQNLFFANKNARLFLKKETVPQKIWIVEGEMDYLTLSMAEDVFVIGVRSGSMSHLQLIPWRKEQTVFIATHDDAAGNRYADEIKRNIHPAGWKRIDMKNLGAII